MNTIAIVDIKINPNQRDVRHGHVQHIAEKMGSRGYNESYPVTLSKDMMLIDGGHRIAAAQAVGITEVPYLVLEADVSTIQHAINCNSDGADTSEYDVFDYATLCWQLAQDGWNRDRVAAELGWGSEAKVTYYSNVKKLLHPRAWELARGGVTRTGELVTADEDSLVTQEVTKVTLTERHFRALLQHLPWQDVDKASMRAQVQAVQEILFRGSRTDIRFAQSEKSITAKWVGTMAARYSWHLQLARYMRDTLVERVGIRARIKLLRAIRDNVFGDSEQAGDLEKFQTAISRLNEKVMGVMLYQDDCLRRIPLLPDNSVALIITDPPYNVTGHEWDKVGTDEEYLDWLQQWLSVVRPKLAQDYHMFLFCDPEYQARIESLLVADGWPLRSRVIWSNRSLPSGRNVDGQFIRTWQMLFHCGTHSLNWSPEWSDERFDVQVYGAPNANMKDGGWHPTPKPEKMVELLVRIGSKPADVVLDPFAGGGTTGAACSTVGQRRCILVEQSDEFCGNIETRLKIQRVSE